MTLFDADRGQSLGHATYPESEQPIDAPHAGWAEQAPSMWWDHFVSGFQALMKASGADPDSIQAIGIAYQMHGLVCVERDREVVRPSIIWCDSRASSYGDAAFDEIGHAKCLSRTLNSPANFTAAKLAWVRHNEPEIYDRIDKFMLPGDYIAMRLTGEVNTTASGLSEGVLWDFPRRAVSEEVLKACGIEASLVPDLVPSIGYQGTIMKDVAQQLGLNSTVQITYRGGDQPNNALSLNVLAPGHIAATAGTSGVMYAVSDQDVADPDLKVNTFLHLNDDEANKRNGILLCVNGAGSMYRWTRQLTETATYEEMNDLASRCGPGAEGVVVFPFGNGSERILGNRNPGASLLGLDVNRHDSSHVARAAMEGVAFAMKLGFDVFRTLDVSPETVAAGSANMFLSPLFRSIFANVTQTSLALYNTSGSEGAARAAAVGSGYFSSLEEALASIEVIEEIDPQQSESSRYLELYERWKTRLEAHVQ